MQKFFRNLPEKHNMNFKALSHKRKFAISWGSQRWQIKIRRFSNFQGSENLADIFDKENQIDHRFKKLTFHFEQILFLVTRVGNPIFT